MMNLSASGANPRGNRGARTTARRAPRRRPAWAAAGDALAAHPIAIALAVAAAARLIHFAGFERSPLAAGLILDAAFYDTWARQIAAGDWLGREVFYANPLYAYFLGLVYRLLGPSPEIARLVQHALGVGTVALITVAARRAFGAGAAAMAGLLAALYRPFLLYEDFILTETLVVFLAALGLVTCFAADRARLAAAGGVKRRHLLAGFVLGLGLLARPTLLPLAALVWLAAGARRNGLVALLGVTLAVAPVTLRNWAVGGAPVLITAHGGETFYVGNRPGADGSNLQPAFVRSGPATEHEDYRREASRRLGRDVDLAASSRYWRDESLRWITAHPGDWLRLLGKKLSFLLHAYEKGDNEDPEAARRLVPLQRLPLPGFALASALGVLGLVAGFASRGAGPELRRPRVLLALACLALAAGCLLYFVTARYRLPLAVPLLAWAGYGAAKLANLAAAPRAARRFLPAAALVAAVLLTFHRPLPALDLNNPAITAVNLGYLLETDGDLDGAIASYRRAIAADPRFALAHFNLGVAERLRGELAAAEAAFRQALALDPDYADALDQLAMTLEQGGDRDSSLALYRRAIAIDSTRPRYFKDLGRLHVLRGEPEAALRAWERALALDPADSTTALRTILLERELFLRAARADSLRGGEPR